MALTSWATLAGCGHTNATASLPLRIVHDIPLPGDTSRFDYQDVDPVRRRLFVAHLGSSQVDVVDLDSLRVVRTLTNVPDVHGIRVDPALGRLYVSATGANQLVTYDEDTLSIIRRTGTGSYPDGIAVDRNGDRVFVSNEHGGSETVVDARAGDLIGTVTLGGEAGNVAVDPVTGQVLVDVQTRNELAVIDPITLRITERHPLPGCTNDHSLLIDGAARLALVACDGNNVLLVVDLDTGRVLSSSPVGDGPDVLAFDKDAGRIYVASESGTVSVFAVNGRTVRRLAQAHLAGHAHSVAVDPNTHRVFFPLQSVGGHPALRVMTPT